MLYENESQPVTKFSERISNNNVQSIYSYCFINEPWNKLLSNTGLSIKILGYVLLNED